MNRAGFHRFVSGGCWILSRLCGRVVQIVPGHGLLRLRVERFPVPSLATTGYMFVALTLVGTEFRFWNPDLTSTICH